MLIIERINKKEWRFSSEDLKEEKKLQNFLTVWIEGAQFSDKFKKGHWDGFVRLFSKGNIFELGLIEDVEDFLKKKKIKFKRINEDFREMKIDSFNIREILYRHQREGVQSFLKENYGLMVVPTRGGKTFISGEIIRIIQKKYKDCQILFYVDTIDLFTQTVGELSDYLKISEDEIGRIDSSGFQPKNITVAMIQTVTSMFKDKAKKFELLRYFKKINFLIVDEVQEYLGKKRMALIKKCSNVEFLLGLSATPFKQMGSEVENLKMKAYFGGIVYEVKKEELQRDGVLALDKLFLVSNINKNYSSEETYQEQLDSQIYFNKKRNEIILEVIDICQRNNFKALILFSSKRHGNHISEISDVRFLSGDDKSKERKEVKEEFLKGEGGVLLASNIFKKGITLPEVEVVMIADGGLEGSALVQKIGRVLGSTKDKKRAAVLDIMDFSVEYFSSHSLNRLEVYEKEIPDNRIELFEPGEFRELESKMKKWLAK